MRKTISLIALFSFCLLLLTSVVLYIVPQGRVAYWANWQLWGLSKTSWSELHINLGLLFVIVGIWHTLLNWSALMNYLRRARQGVCSVHGALAVVVTLGVTLGTLFHLPPLDWVLKANTALKNRAALKYGEPPYGHAELSSLKMLVRNTGLSLDEVLMRAAQAKLTGVAPDRSVEQIAADNQLSPQQLFELIQPRLAAGEFPALPSLPPAGLGRNSLAQICATYGLDCSVLSRQLAEHGLEVTAEMTLKQIAADHDKNPIEVYELIRQLTLGE